MKATNLIKTVTLLIFAMVLSTSVFAQDKPCSEKTEKQVSAEECKTKCSDAKAKECKTAKHVCTEECKTEGCATVDAEVTTANEAKHVCTDECKTAGCASVKAKECKTEKHVCTDECKTAGCDAVKVSYECPMKCEPASDKPGECSKCGMELKKKA
ncbi:MAG: heavy metal-binding domain-containing protein [Melioribacteraceae bacterium]|jgi:hypothetical protein|nr:heavy metal-binding domain-containing protein [Melioribacteraceae bacterium]